jgi:hypothetical protein
MRREPNELLISVAVLQDLLVTGAARTWRVDHGPSDQARLMNVRRAGEWIVLEYDRPVDEPELVLVCMEGQHPSGSSGVACGVVAFSCACNLALDHGDVHECECGARWRGRQGVDLEVVRWPQKDPVTGEKMPWADVSVGDPLTALRLSESKL